MKLVNLRLIIRHLRSNRLFTVVTFLGFSISLLFIILLSVYIKQESSVDNFHTKKDRIYRFYHEGGQCNMAYRAGPDLMSLLPEIENFTMLFERKDILSYADQRMAINYLLVDSSFFNIFDFKLLEGDKSEVLKTSQTIVLSQSYARKIFNADSPIGKEVSFANQSYMVSGIMKDFPYNTHFKACDAIVNFQTLPKQWGNPELLTNYDNNSFSLYFLARRNSNLPSKAPIALEFLKKEVWMYRDGVTKTAAFEPLQEVYFSNGAMPGIKQNSRTLLQILSAITLLILVLAIINYTNLTIAQSASRSKAMAIRKLMGSSKRLLIWQSVTESLFICSLAALGAIAMSLLAEPFFNKVLETHIDIQSNLSGINVLVFVVFILIVGLLAGAFPALAITRINPIQVVKGIRSGGKHISNSKILVAFQFCAVIILLICSAFMFKQTHFMQDKNLGFDRENIISFQDYVGPEHREAFKNEIQKIADVQEIAFVQGSPFDGGNNNSFTINDKPHSFQIFGFDSVFIKMIGLQITPTGAAFSRDGIYINETGFKDLELEENATSFDFFSRKVPILGVVKDFNFSSLHQKIGPAFIFQLPPNGYAWSIFIKLSKNASNHTLQSIQKVYEEFTDGKPLDIQFADATINNYYKKEIKTTRIIGYFTILTLIISVMGILALSIFYAHERVKEIGIRKVNGARNLEMVSLLTGDFIRWITFAFIVGCPIAYFAVTKWLQHFAYKTEISWWVFALAGIIVASIAMLTVSWQCWQVANRNPVESLRYE